MHLVLAAELHIYCAFSGRWFGAKCSFSSGLEAGLLGVPGLSVQLTPTLASLPDYFPIHPVRTDVMGP